ncbi:MAG: serine hydrolase [Proteobacteria bacterium]|nr:serine hydrolase [Pseudomonadota bacterium]
MTPPRRLACLLRAAAAFAACGTAALLAGCAAPERAALTATGYVSHQLCSAVFVGGLEPDRYFRQAIAPLGGPFAGLFRQEVDRAHGEVRASLAGLAESRAVYRPPLGCVNATGLPTGDLPPVAAPPAASAPPLLPPIAGPAVVEPSMPALQAALARAFDETPQPPHPNTQAIVVLHDDRVIAERYADGIGVDTPLPGWSATKSMTNALLGILVRAGRLDMQAPAPVAAWADPHDPRHAITPDELLRMTSGLAMGQTLHDVSPFDPAAQMLFASHDMAKRAARAPLADPPGTHWNYSDANTMLLSRLIADRAGGDPASVLAYVHRALFDKLGMRGATLEFDAAGTPIGGSHLWAPARDWARLGLLFLHDGVVGGERILPERWVDASARMTPGADYVGYGAGFWTNRGPGYGAQYRIAHGMPADAYMMRGSYGQYVVIVPSRQLVVVRLGPAFTPRDDMDAVCRLIADVIDALGIRPAA